jgi:glycine/D-amino acid oxidase-like deaminating enzyme
MRRSNLDGQGFDVIVCGAGSGGSAAAYGAARNGARTLLIESRGFCGGTPVGAAIHTLDAVRSCADTSRLVVGGYARKLIETVIELGGESTEDNPPEAPTFNLEYMKVAADRVLTEAGVTLLFQSMVVGAEVEGNRVSALEVATLDGRASLKGKIIIDGTGDAAIAYHAGAETRMDEYLQPLTYHFRIANVKRGKTWSEWEDAGREALKRHAPEGLIYGGPWIIRLTDTEISVNTTRVYANPVDPLERSHAERQARAQMLVIFDILKASIPELSDAYLCGGAAELHIRESRKILGEYTLTEDDIVQGRVFPDAIAYGAWPFDVHPCGGFVGVHPHKESPPVPYGIPYRVLIPKGFENLLVVGKAISTTHKVHGSTRVPGTSMATGHVAGVAAALAARDGCGVGSVAITELRDELRRQEAILPPAAG